VGRHGRERLGLFRELLNGQGFVVVPSSHACFSSEIQGFDFFRLPAAEAAVLAGFSLSRCVEQP
jgi:hypothetical protein